MHIHGINFRNHLGMKSPAALFLKSSQSLLWKLSKTWGKQRDASDTNPMSSGLTPVTSPSTRCDPQGNQRVLKTQNALLGNLQFGCFQRWWYPQIIHFNRVFHYKPTILGYPHFWKLAIFNSITNHQIIENWWGETAAFVWAKWRQHSGLNGSSTSRFVLNKKPIKDAISVIPIYPGTLKRTASLPPFFQTGCQTAKKRWGSVWISNFFPFFLAIFFPVFTWPVLPAFGILFVSKTGAPKWSHTTGCG